MACLGKVAFSTKSPIYDPTLKCMRWTAGRLIIPIFKFNVTGIKIACVSSIQRLQPEKLRDHVCCINASITEVWRACKKNGGIFLSGLCEVLIAIPEVTLFDKHSSVVGIRAVVRKLCLQTWPHDKSGRISWAFSTLLTIDVPFPLSSLLLIVH